MPDTKRDEEARVKKLVDEAIARRDAADESGKLTAEQKTFARVVAREVAAAVVRELQSTEDEEEEEEPQSFVDSILNPRKAKK